MNAGFTPNPWLNPHEVYLILFTAYYAPSSPPYRGMVRIYA